MPLRRGLGLLLQAWLALELLVPCPDRLARVVLAAPATTALLLDRTLFTGLRNLTLLARGPGLLRLLSGPLLLLRMLLLRPGLYGLAWRRLHLGRRLAWRGQLLRLGRGTLCCRPLGRVSLSGGRLGAFVAISAAPVLAASAPASTLLLYLSGRTLAHHGLDRRRRRQG